MAASFKPRERTIKCSEADEFYFEHAESAETTLSLNNADDPNDEREIGQLEFSERGPDGNAPMQRVKQIDKRHWVMEYAQRLITIKYTAPDFPIKINFSIWQDTKGSNPLTAIIHVVK